MDDETVPPGGTPSDPPDDSPVPNPNEGDTGNENEMRTFTLVASNYQYNVSEIRVQQGDRVRIVLENAGGTHDWVVDEFSAQTDRIQAGGQATVEFVADQAGTFAFYCSVGNHRAQGMEGRLIVE